MVNLIQTGICDDSYKKLKKMAFEQEKSQYKILQDIVEDALKNGRITNTPKNQNRHDIGTTPTIKREPITSTLPEGELGE